MRTFKLTLSYDGTDFSGFQRQANARSVQAELEAALAAIEGAHVTVAGAGRTDAGVHALGQVASFKLSSAIAERDLLRALNAKLPEDVRVLSAEVAAPGFNARFSARSKMYRYRISNTRVMSPFQRRFAWHVSRNLDLVAMNEAARSLVGEHDFSCFQAAPSRSEQTASTARLLLGERERAETTQKRTATRTMTRSEWTEEPLPGGGRLLIYEIAGTGFLKYMVRAVVGTLVEVGDGGRTPASVRDVLNSRDRAAAGPTAPPAGLYLVRVDYDTAAPVSF
ncbi:MAG: tRNA pseudouridine(38-40) synthase TruA [Vicinamibacterales bacterium]